MAITRRYFVSGLSSLAALAGLRMVKIGEPFPGIRMHALDPLSSKLRNAGTGIKVFVNGLELKYCLAFDSREGWAEYYKDPTGKEPPNARVARVYGKITTQPPVAELIRLVSQLP